MLYGRSASSVFLDVGAVTHVPVAVLVDQTLLVPGPVLLQMSVLVLPRLVDVYFWDGRVGLALPDFVDGDIAPFFVRVVDLLFVAVRAPNFVDVQRSMVVMMSRSLWN